LKNQLAETATQRDTAQKAELEARKRARELDERAKISTSKPRGK